MVRNSPYEFIRKLLCEISFVSLFDSVTQLVVRRNLCVCYILILVVLMLRELNYINLYCRGGRKAVNYFSIHLE